jgi:hypothetical protein
MPRYFGCAASYLLERDLKDSGSAAATLGTKRHKLMEDDATEFEDSEDEFACTRARDLVIKALEDTKLMDCDDLEDFREDRIWMLNASFKKIISGQYDRLFISKEADLALVIDYKMVSGGHTEASNNEQLLTLGVLIRNKHKVNRVVCALIQPFSGDKALTYCELDEGSLELAEQRLRDQLALIVKKGNKPTPGLHCKYCKYAPDCDVAKEDAMAVTKIETDVARPASAELLDKIAFAKKLLEDLEKSEKEKAIKMLEADPDSLEGYKLMTRKTTTVDAEKAWPLLINHLAGIEIAAAMKLSVPKLVKPFKESLERKPETADVSLKQARQILDEKLIDCTRTTESAPFLKRS